MIQAIGLMIGAYMVFRSIDTLSDKKKPLIVKASAIMLTIISISGTILIFSLND